MGTSGWSSRRSGISSVRVARRLELPGRGLGDRAGPLDQVRRAGISGLVSSSTLPSLTSSMLVLLAVAVFVVVIVVDMSG